MTRSLDLVNELKRVRELEAENSRLKKMYAELALENTAIKRRLPFLSNKVKIETSVLFGGWDEEVEVHGKSDCGYFG